MKTFFPWERVRKSKTVWVSLIMITLLMLVGILAPWLAPADPYEQSTRQKNLPAMWVQSRAASGLVEHPLGTDFFGRDILSRLMYGTRTALILGLAAVSLAGLIGTIVGLASGYLGGRVDAGIMYFVDTINALPGIMFMVMIVLIFRSLLTPSWSNGMITLVIGFALVGWVSLARLVRIHAMQIKSQVFMEAARSLGASPGFIITHHLLPNVLPVIIVWVITTIPAVILLEAVLGYIGVGVTSAIDGGQFTTVSWGGMFFSGRSAWSRNPLMLLVPSALLLFISMSFILLGDFLSRMTRQE